MTAVRVRALPTESADELEGLPPSPQARNEPLVPPADPLIAALARYLEALHRRYPDGPEELRRQGLDGRATITQMSDHRKDPAA
jgi:hypothetical protein